MESRKLKVCNALINEAYEIMHSLCFDPETKEYVTPGDTEEECDDFNIVMGDIMKTRREFNNFVSLHTKQPLPLEIRAILRKEVESIISKL